MSRLTRKEGTRTDKDIKVQTAQLSNNPALALHITKYLNTEDITGFRANTITKYALLEELKAINNPYMPLFPSVYISIYNKL